MRNGRALGTPIYELPHGIGVISETSGGKYVRCYIIAHELFPRSKINKQGRQLIQRSRVVMTAALGRPLATNEHVHHIDENDKHNDSLENLEVLWSDEHNRHHKSGFKHSEATKRQIGTALQLAFKEGRKVQKGSWLPENYKHSDEVKENTASRRRGTIWITDGKMTKTISSTNEVPEGWRRGRGSLRTRQQEHR
jgi:hypothetical protein